MKYKVGDRVRIVGNKHHHQFNVGTLVEITGVGKTDYKCYGIDDDGNKSTWWVYEGDISLIDYTWEDFLKCPIGTKVTFERGKCIFKVDKDEWGEEFANTFDNYSYKEFEGFELKDSDYGKITKIEEPTYTTVYEPTEQVEEMTLEEVCKELGREIKIVKEK